MLDRIPVVDVGPFLRNAPAGCGVPAAIRQAREDVGVFTIIGNGVRSALINENVEAAHASFTLSTKHKLG